MCSFNRGITEGTNFDNLCLMFVYVYFVLCLCRDRFKRKMMLYYLRRKWKPSKESQQANGSDQLLFVSSACGPAVHHCCQTDVDHSYLGMRF